MLLCVLISAAAILVSGCRSAQQSCPSTCTADRSHFGPHRQQVGTADSPQCMYGWPQCLYGCHLEGRPRGDLLHVQVASGADGQYRCGCGVEPHCLIRSLCHSHLQIHGEHCWRSSVPVSPRVPASGQALWKVVRADAEAEVFQQPLGSARRQCAIYLILCGRTRCR